MEIVYVGPFSAVEVRDWPDEHGELTVVQRGEPVEAPDDLAERLLRQTRNWQRPAAKKAKAKATAPAGADAAGQETTGDHAPEE